MTKSKSPPSAFDLAYGVGDEDDGRALKQMTTRHAVYLLAKMTSGSDRANWNWNNIQQKRRNDNAGWNFPSSLKRPTQVIVIGNRAVYKFTEGQ
jgi:hypothetical protein